MKKYTIELTEREILLLNSWLDIIKKEKPNYYNEYTHTVFDIFKKETNKIRDNIERQYKRLSCND